ncbi:hypothetical protein LLEC1_00451 [Akanthomyces lecanii]|uniref:C2H2-type domain-containing protein n=1 Tax=Cordyceps confragosa TaxID=2714763 RepID=A0A179IIR5_CORDF|nr:hypothetical protein LLEC1_00451 [Akanthomyces lecanii]
MEGFHHHGDSGNVPRVTDSPKAEPAFRKRFSETFRLNPSSQRRHSRAHSICSSVSSAHFFDSDTAYSASSVASPISTVYESEAEDFIHPPFLERPSSRVAERGRQHFASFDSGSTWVGDTEEEERFNQDKLENTMKAAFANSLSPKICGDNLESPVTTQHLSDDDTSISGNSEGNISAEVDANSPGTLICDASSVATDEAAGSDADTLLTYTLQLVYGIDAPEQEPQLGNLRRLSARYIRLLGDAISQPISSDGEQPSSQGNSYPSNTPSPLNNGRRGSQSGSSQASSKRKQEGDPGEDGQENGQGSGFLPVKKAKHAMRDDGSLRLSCPFRKRNPQRFNVRDHHSCAMTYFPKFAELRQHIVKQHKRDDPSAFVCDRCNRDFRSRKELREHQRQPKEFMCDLADHDPESGIDGPTCNKLLSRKRASGTSPIVQWKEIWNLLFPDDDDHVVQTFNFTPVIEHFELAAQFYTSFDHLRASLQDKISNQATLDTIWTKFHQCFAESVEQCHTTAQGLTYVNRSNKKAELSKTPRQPARSNQRMSNIQPRPDSGIMLDDGSEESGSVSSSGVCYNESNAVLHMLNSDQHGFVFGDSSGTPALSVQTPASVFDSDLLSSSAQLIPRGRAMTSHPQADLTRLWTDEMVYNMTSMGNADPNATPDRKWDDTPAHMAFYDSTTPNLF